MTDKLTDKQKVQAVWTDARCVTSNFVPWVAIYSQRAELENSILELGIGRTENEAWADAARFIDDKSTKE